ncbi:NUDIX domain-containing protein [Saccharibacillus sp. CPCC 101409]|uniref:NUDIX hydrolase n=1 Tax=Saccharibacillus sp. CPCC 101409 TaxID=3058041 RepID=UPI0026735B9B|nr:NUDIX domain-containing protein [Saccharibacillus sp. CPCC 101409]MDO3412193.1 NUDIX domain-containing protein [Saccharibacillus sp. CPCC 101409]
MSVSEVLDIFNERHERIGTAPRGEVHERGLWHQVFHCWIVSGSAESGRHILFQLRHPDKETFPDKLDTSSAGHLLAGEAPEDGVRELEEELGLVIPYEKLIYCGLHREEYRISEHYMDREFTHVHLAVCDLPLERYSVQRSEVSGLFWLDSRDFRELVRGERDRARAEGVVYDDRLRPIREERLVSLDDFTANTADYYELLFGALSRLESGGFLSGN